MHASQSSGVLITGSAGFIGAHLARMLAGNGWRVVAVSRKVRNGESIANVRNVELSLCRDSASWQAALTSIQSVVHLAAHVHQTGSKKGRDEGLFREVNVEGSRFVAERAARAGVRRLIFLSSIKVNGEITDGRPFGADDVPLPQDAYANSKLEAEVILREICFRANMELVIVRPPLVYGPGVRANFRLLMRLVALGLPLPFRSLDNRRSLISVWNLTHFIEVCLNHEFAAGRTWLISDGQDLSTSLLIAKLTTLMRKRPRQFSVAPRHLRILARLVGLEAEMSRLCDSLQVDISPATEQLLWRPTLDVDEGLARTVAAYNTVPSSEF